MSQSDLNVANADGATVRADINSQLEALATNSSGSTAPPVTFPYMPWVDTSGTPILIKKRNGANTAWITIGSIVSGQFVPYTDGESANSKYAPYETYQNIAVFDTAGVTSWNVPDVLNSGNRKAHVTVIGGGGGASKLSSVAGGGGGGGGAAIVVLSLNGVTSVQVTVGAGGVGSATSGNNGTGGGTSSFGEFCSATGGAGGFGVGGGGQGGQGSGGDINVAGSPGGHANNQVNSRWQGGLGGDSLLSGGAWATVASGNQVGLNGTLGSGGSGGTQNGNGGNGGDGIVIVRW